MKNTLPIIALIYASCGISAQTVLYNQNFNGVSAPDLPGDWFATSDQIFTNGSTASTGYSGASGGNNLLSRNCNPNNQMRSCQVDGISSVNHADLTVSFGHRRTNSFTPLVTLEWSNDGASWNAITYNSSGAGTSWALFTSATLPAGADDQASLSFRWTYTTAVSNIPCNEFAGNYRIDDFKVTAATVLPVQMVSFTGLQIEKSVLLSWHTATETSNDFFAVERSADSRTFIEIGRERGAGTTAEPREYTFIDAQPLPGFNYYRLRQVDVDGQYAYSRVVAVQTSRATDIRVFPSPAADFLNIQLEQTSDENVIYEVFDLAGRPVLTGKIPSEHVDAKLNVADLPVGAYHLRVVAGRDCSVRQFQKQ